jgi:hypothetical protein
MAERYSTRRKAKSSVGTPNALKRQVTRRKPSSEATSGSTADNREPALRLREVACILNVVYSTCVTVELALKGQNADQDCDILAMLRMSVAEPVSRQAERLHLIAQSLAK